MKVLDNVKQKSRDVLALGIALPLVILVYASFLSLFALPIVFLFWLVKHLF
jgi:hypothetical protein